MANLDQICNHLADEEWGPMVSFSSTNMTVYNCTGTISGNINIRVRKDLKAVWASGRVAITNFTRTGNNPGVKLANFENLGIPTGLYIFVGIRGEAAFERAQIVTTDGLLTTTESYQNASSGRLSFNLFNGIYFFSD